MNAENQKLTVYLSGRIAGCTDEEKNGWRDRFTEKYQNVRNPMHRPFNENGTFEDVKRIVEGDKLDIDESDIVLVYYVSPSVGTSMEIMYAFERKIPIVVCNPTNAVLSPWISYHCLCVCNTEEDALHTVLLINRISRRED